jgi:hypothetical protein
MAYTFAGIDPSQSRTGLQAQQDLEKIFGSPLSQQQKTQAGQYLQGLGYSDMTGQAGLSGDQYNKLMQEAARLTGGQFNAWQAPAPQASTGIEFQSTPAPSYQAPELEMPAPYQAPAPFQYDAYQGADPFAYDAYRSTTAADMTADPGYQFRLAEGQKALERSRAAQGIYRGGATMKALADYGQNAASQEFSNVDARRRADYQLGYGTASDIYDRNVANQRADYQQGYGTARDIYGVNTEGGRYAHEQAVDAAQRRYDAASEGAQAEYAPNLLSWQTQREDQNRAAELNFDRDWQSQIYNRDDAFRRQEADRNEAFRNRTYEGDAAYRTWLANLQNQQFIAELGTRQ